MSTSPSTRPPVHSALPGALVVGALLAALSIPLLLAPFGDARSQENPAEPAPARIQGAPADLPAALTLAAAQWTEGLGAEAEPQWWAFPETREYVARVDLPGGETRAAISIDGTSFAWEGPVGREIHLRYRRFDPLAGEPAVPQTLAAGEGGGPEPPVFLVQMITQPLEAYRRELAAAGARIHKFVADQSYLAAIDPADLEAVRALSFVRWVGPYHPAYRLEEALLAPALDPASAGDEAARYHLMVFERGPRQKESLAAFVLSLGGRIEAAIPDGFLLEASLTPAQLAQVARRNEVQFIDRWFAPDTDMDIAREIGGANYVEAMGGFTGRGVVAEVMDGNLNFGHLEFAHLPPLQHGPVSGSQSHGTNTFGVVFARGVNAQARGMVPDAQGIFASYSHLQNRYQHTAALLHPPFEAVLQSNSWGGGLTTQYTTVSAEMDDILLLHDITVLQSQSNTGNTFSRPQAWSKNIVSLGGVAHLDTLTKADDFWGNWASIGPASDGRIKPDLTHFRDNVYTTNSNGGYSSNFGGTSAATPITAGYFALFFEMWAQGVFGNAHDPARTVFENRPRRATAKAVMIHTAEAYPFAGPGSDLARPHQGWGMVDLKSLYDQRQEILVVDELFALSPLETHTFQLQVEPGSEALRLTLSYTDPAGVPSSSVHRINHLRLSAQAPNEVRYFGNFGLLDGNWSQPFGLPAAVDTVQNIFVQNPVPGLWTVRVQAVEINEDAHLATPELDAVYALVASGIVRPAPGAVVVPGCSQAGGELAVAAGEPRLGATLTLSAGAPSLGTAVVQFALGTTSLDLGAGCGLALDGWLGELLIDPSSPYLLFSGMQQSGAPALLPLEIPATPGLLGVVLYSQALFAGQGGELAWSSGLRLELGL